MKRKLTVLTLVALAGAASLPVMCHAMDKETALTPAMSQNTASSPIPPGAPPSFADLASTLLPAVVNISSTLKADAPEAQGQNPLEQFQFPPGSPFQDFFKDFMERQGQGMGQGQEQAPALPATSMGSGFIIDAAKGYIVTNNHVIQDADEVRVILHDDSTLTAKVIGKDEKLDLAVLKVDTDKKLTAISFGASSKMRVGDWILAIGNPFGLGGTVTAGIISAQQRNINAGPYDDFIQTDASINRGNSGGPMFNLKGEVIGINTAIYSPSGGSVGIGFAIPSDLAQSVVKQLIEYGKTRRGWIGVHIQSVTEEIAESLSLPTSHGALVANVTPDGPAEKAKLKSGDIITRFDGKEINAMRNLPRIVAETAIGETVPVTVWRDGKEITLKIKVAELEKAEKDGLLDDEAKSDTDTTNPSKGTELKDLGLTLGSLTDTVRKAYNVPDDVEGVAITNISPASDALQKGIGAGDVIVEVNQEKIETPKQVVDAVEKSVKSGKSTVLFLINHEGDLRFVALKVSKDKK